MIFDPWLYANQPRLCPRALVIALGRVGNQTWVATNGRWKHAEAALIGKIPRSIPGCRIHVQVFRVSHPQTSSSPIITMARPCTNCQARLWRRGVKARNVWYAGWDGDFHRMSNE